jgi:hypothetical protein
MYGLVRIKKKLLHCHCEPNGDDILIGPAPVEVLLRVFERLNEAFRKPGSYGHVKWLYLFRGRDGSSRTPALLNP